MNHTTDLELGVAKQAMRADGHRGPRRADLLCDDAVWQSTKPRPEHTSCQPSDLVGTEPPVLQGPQAPRRGLSHESSSGVGI